jgi:uncharacterized protein
MTQFWIFAIIGFCAQIIDSSLGMGFGIISSSVLLSQGIPPALVSASVNAAKLPTTGTAALSHLFHKNVDPKLLWPVAIFGAIGGVVGAMILAGLKGKALTSVVTVYLFFIGSLIVWRGVVGIAPRVLPAGYTRLIGFVGGLIEGIGGSWGPVVTTSLMGSGAESRYAIGSGNVAEFLVSIAVFSAFVTAYFIGHWEGGADWATVAWPVAGLVAGGLPAAIFGGMVSKVTPRRALTIAVGLLAISIGVYRLVAA